MEFYSVLKTRKSIREFESKRIPTRVISKIVKAASLAASSGNRQPWIFYVVQSKSKRDKISEILRSTLKHFDLSKSPYGDITKKFYSDLGGAPCVIFVYCDLSTNKHKPEWSLRQSVSLAVGNLMNTAVAEGLGTCWVGSFLIYEKEISKLLGAPKNSELVAPIIIGYPKKGYVPLKRTKKKLKEILVWR